MTAAALSEVAQLQPADADLLWHHLSGSPVIILDFDGTLTPIVDDPATAQLPADRQRLLARLNSRFPVGVVSGRALEDLRRRIDIPGVLYAGSHGMELALPGIDNQPQPVGRVAAQAVDIAARKITFRLADLPGVRLERKPLSLAVHTREAGSEELRKVVETVVSQVAAEFPEVTLLSGRQVVEVRPNVPWDKGSAVDVILESLPDGHLPLYIGDDITDEDGFRQAKARNGVGVLVANDETPQRTVTSASYAVDGVPAVWELLESLMNRAG